MAKAPADLRSLARSYTALAVQTLAGIAQNGENEGARVQASNSLLDRGWGRPATTHTGEGGDGPIAFVIRHILEQRAAGAPNGTVTIEGSSNQENVLAGPWTRPDDDQGEQ
jgi:hypothetical protein